MLVVSRELTDNEVGERGKALLDLAKNAQTSNSIRSGIGIITVLINYGKSHLNE